MLLILLKYFGSRVCVIMVVYVVSRSYPITMRLVRLQTSLKVQLASGRVFWQPTATANPVFFIVPDAVLDQFDFVLE